MIDDITKLYYLLPNHFHNNPPVIQPSISPYFKIMYNGVLFSTTSDGEINPPRRDKDLTIIFEDQTGSASQPNFVGVNLGVYFVGEGESPGTTPGSVDVSKIKHWFHMTPYNENHWMFRINESLAHYLNYGKIYHIYFYVAYVAGTNDFPGTIQYIFDLDFRKINAVDSYYGNDIDNLYYSLNLGG